MIPPAACEKALSRSAASVRRRPSADFHAADFHDKELGEEEPGRAASEEETAAQYKAGQSLAEESDWRKGKRGRQQEELLSGGAQKMDGKEVDQYEGPRGSERSRKEEGRDIQRQPEVSDRGENGGYGKEAGGKKTATRCTEIDVA